MSEANGKVLAIPDLSLTHEEIMELFELGEVNREEMCAWVRAREAQAAQKSRGGGRLYSKVSPKGGISVYGLQRMPVTLYVEQWERLLAFADELREFITRNRGDLSTKANPRPRVEEPAESEETEPAQTE